MADKKISQLTGATTPLAGTEEVPLVQSSSTKKVSVANLTAGRTVSATGFSTEATSTNLSITGATVQAGGVNTNVSIILATKGSGGVEIPAGAAATPAIRFAADTDTGIYADTANTLVVANGGVETLRTTTDNTLQIGSSTGATPKVFVYANNSVGDAETNAAVYIRQDGTNHIQTWAGPGGNIRGYWEAAGDLVVDDGNIRFVTSGKGIDFSATTEGSGTMTSELLADYEEGTWTPVAIGTTTAGTCTYVFNTGSYTKVGRLVYFQMELFYTDHTGTGDLQITGLPFTVATSGTAIANPSGLLFSNNLVIVALSGGTALVPFTYASDASRTFLPMDAAAIITVSGTYSV